MLQQWNHRQEPSTKQPSPQPKIVVKRGPGTGSPDPGTSTPRQDASTAEASEFGQHSTKPENAAKGSVGKEYDRQSDQGVKS